MLLNPSTTFKFDSFVYFYTHVEGKHEAILMKWIIDMNSGINHLAFECKKQTFGHKLGILIWG
jgi:hypothetical protein